METGNSQQNLVSSFPPPPPYFRLFDEPNKAMIIKPPPCIEGPFTCFGSQLSSEISVHPLDSDTAIYDQNSNDLHAELKRLNKMFQFKVLEILENAGKGIVDPSLVKTIVKIYNNINHILEKLRIIQAYHRIYDELELQVKEKNHLIDQMKQLIDQYNTLTRDPSESENLNTEN
ncbi:Mediator complex, subunit Med7 [Cryptosporidium felis]|nr:Mediator complex, subunit Med7 [Cryptosporidium felis]